MNTVIKDTCGYPYPQGENTCWFNAILTVLFNSNKTRELFIKENNLILSKINPELDIYSFFQIILDNKNFNNKNIMKDIFVKYTPEKILDLLYKYNKDLFYINAIIGVNGFNSSYYLKPFFELFNLNSIFFDIYNDEMYVSNLNFIKNVKYNDDGYDINYETDINNDKNMSLTMKGILEKNIVPEIIVIILYDDETIKITIDNDNDELINKIKRLSIDNDIKINMQHIDKYYNIRYNDCKYNLEAVILGNYNIINGNNENHLIAGFHCKNDKVVYNGVYDDTEPCNFIKYDWDIHTLNQFCYNTNSCKIDSIKKDDLCYDFGQGYRILLYVKT